MIKYSHLIENIKIIYRILSKQILKYNYMLFGNPKLKQELLFRLALKEKGFDLKKIEIHCDHNLGLNYANNLVFGIKYPDSFYFKSNNIIPNTKSYDFYFNGMIYESGQRSLLLMPFNILPKTIIIQSKEGRTQRNKDKFNFKYFFGLANSKFGLCPHQMDWKGSKQDMWTYRFIECCFVKTMPVLFRETPLGENFISGFHFLWNDYILNNTNEVIYDNVKVEENHRLAKIKFCLTEDECLQIEKSIKKI